MHRFCIAVVEGSSLSAAYREAYDARDMNDGAVAVEATRLARRAMVHARIEELRLGLQRSLGYTRATLLRELEEAQQLARQGNDARALLNIVATKARLLGFLDHPAKPKSERQRQPLDFGSALFGDEDAG
jgi:hypothetical protein